MTTTTRTEQAHHAVRAAQERKVWGDYAARRYCALRGVHPSLYRLARQLEAARDDKQSTTSVSPAPQRPCGKP